MDKIITQNRMLWIDALKGFGIIMVMIGHVISNQSMYSRFIYAFHMPLFFFLAGYVYNGENCDLSSTIRRACSLGVMYLVYSFLFLLLDVNALQLHLQWGGGGGFIDVLTGRGVSVTWFLFALLFVDLLGRVIISYSSTYFVIIICSVAGFVALLTARYVHGFLVSMNIILAMLVFWCFAYLLKFYKAMSRILALRKLMISVFIIVLMAIFSCFIFNSRVDVRTCLYGNAYLFYPISLSGIFLLFFIAYGAPKLLLQIFAYFGMRSLLYMVLHLPINAIVKNWFCIDNSVCYRFISILLLVGVVEILYRWAPFSYGRFARKYIH